MNTHHVAPFEINPISERDAWRLCNFIVSNETHLKRFFPITLASNLSPDLSAIFVEQKVAEFTTGQEFLFTLKEPVHRKIIGLVYIKEIDTLNKEAELAYCIGYSKTNKGFASKAVKIVSDWCFTKYNFETLRIIVHNSNIASIKVAENCGYHWSKTLNNEFTPPNESPLDMELYLLKK